MFNFFAKGNVGSYTDKVQVSTVETESGEMEEVSAT